MFLSYAHESDGHKQAVVHLSTFLRANHIEARLDRYAEDRSRDWAAWMQAEIELADFVLVVASPGYRRAADGHSAPGERRGVSAEARLLRDRLHADHPTWRQKIVPVLLPGFTEADIPPFLLPASGTCHRVTELSEEGAGKLLRLLTGQPAHIPPPLGKRPHLPPYEPTELSLAVPEATALAAGAPLQERPDRPWRGGDEVSVNGIRYLVRDPVPAEQAAPDRGAVRREALAGRLGPESGLVLLRQVVEHRTGQTAATWRSELEAEARLLSELEQVRGVPHRLDAQVTARAVTLVAAQPTAPTWREVFGPTDRPLDIVRATRLLRAARSLCSTLGALHRLGYAHRALTPDAVLVGSRDSGLVLRSLGLATVGVAAGEGPPEYRAPEQERPVGHGDPPGPHTDVYRLAAMLYHTICGRAPGMSTLGPPPSAVVPGLPLAVDEVLARALDRSPRNRPRSMTALAAGLRPDGRR
ncbi:MAG TPA: SEFIR domain-containing protein [Mycobacteriales bacterium]|nr:SEFIR domain-containing protein [Mycobacteriales bacterium]